MNRALSSLLGGLLLGLVLLAPPRALAWEPIASMPTARSETAAAVWGDSIYVPGGLGGTRSFEAYDTGSGRWRALPPLPEGRHHPAVVAHDGKIFVFGGADASWRASAASFVFDIAGNAWRRGADLPAVRYAAAAVVLDDQIYVVGGDGPGGHTLRYDPQRDRWSTLPPTLHRREHTGASAHDGKILIAGGRWSGVGELDSTEIYDPAAHRWRDGPRLLTSRGGFAVVNHAGRIYALGGEVMMSGNETLTSVERFDGDAWVSAPPLPRALHGLPAASHGGYLYVLGGSRRAGAIVNDGAAFRSDAY